jgi:hypothetical protein
MNTNHNDYPLIYSAVMDMIDCMSNKSLDGRPAVCMDKLDYGQYGDHTVNRPYNTVLEGVNWYMNQEKIEHIPEELIVSIVAKNFGITFQEAVDEMNETFLKKDGIVNFS